MPTAVINIIIDTLVLESTSYEYIYIYIYNNKISQIILLLIL